MDESKEEAIYRPCFEAVDIAKEVSDWANMAIVKRMKDSIRDPLVMWASKFSPEEYTQPQMIEVCCNENRGSLRWDEAARAFWDPNEFEKDEESEKEDQSSPENQSGSRKRHSRTSQRGQKTRQRISPTPEKSDERGRISL
jgi:hypothetical protein